MKTRLGWAVVEKTRNKLQHWSDHKAREQFDVFVDRESARLALIEWEANTGEPHKLVRCRISIA